MPKGLRCGLLPQNALKRIRRRRRGGSSLVARGASGVRRVCERPRALGLTERVVFGISYTYRRKVQVRMRRVVVNPVLAFMVAFSSVCGWHAAANEVRRETARDLLCVGPERVDSWRLNPPLPERLTPVKERLSLDGRIKPGPAVAVTGAVFAKTDALYGHRAGASSAVSCVAQPHSLFSISCLLIV